jgi:hypothetical protein
VKLGPRAIRGEVYLQPLQKLSCAGPPVVQTLASKTLPDLLRREPFGCKGEKIPMRK